MPPKPARQVIKAMKLRTNYLKLQVELHLKDLYPQFEQSKAYQS